MKYLYENFLENKSTYRWNKFFWKQSIQNLFNNELNFETYVTDKFANGRLFYDGNPIVSGKYPKQKKAFRIIQENPKEFENFYTSFINEESDTQYPELVIVLTLTQETKQRAMSELYEWVQR